MKKIFSYIHFLFKSKTKHGVHSPFIYDFITKGLTQKSEVSSSKSDEIFYKTVSYFDPKNVRVFDEDDELKNVLTEFFLDLKHGNNSVELFFFNKNLANNEFERYLLSNLFHNNSIVIIKDIRASKTIRKMWTSLLDDPRITVTLDLYHTGMLFFRDGQVKENFTIRA